MINKGDIVFGTITNIASYGAFVSVDEYYGLIHISEISDAYVKDINNFIKIGDKVKLKVISVDEDKKRLQLSYKHLNKARGIKCEIPKFRLGFKTLRDHLPQFIREQTETED